MTEELVDVLVCSKCGVLSPTDPFIMGYIAGRHDAHYSSDKHKFQIKQVPKDTKIIASEQLTMLVALQRRKMLRKPK